MTSVRTWYHLMQKWLPTSQREDAVLESRAWRKNVLWFLDHLVHMRPHPASHGRCSPTTHHLILSKILPMFFLHTHPGMLKFYALEGWRISGVAQLYYIESYFGDFLHQYKLADLSSSPSELTFEEGTPPVPSLTEPHLRLGAAGICSPEISSIFSALHMALHCRLLPGQFCKGQADFHRKELPFNPTPHSLPIQLFT